MKIYPHRITKNQRKARWFWKVLMSYWTTFRQPPFDYEE